MFDSIKKALAWRNRISPDQVEYLKTVDQFIARMEPGEIVNFKEIVAPERYDLFWKALSYVLLACSMHEKVAFSVDFWTMKLKEA